MKTMRMAMTILLGALAAAGSRATTYTWTPLGAGSANAYNWTNAPYWGGSGYPKLAGDVANLNNDITNILTVSLRANIAVGTLNIGDAACTNGLGQATNNFNTIVQNTGSESYALTLDSGVTNVPAQINCSGSGTPTVYLNAPMALNSDVLISIGGSDTNNRPYLTVGNSAVMTVAMNGHTLTFTNGVFGQNQISLASAMDFTGNGTIVNNALPSIDVASYKTFGGTIVANSGKGGSNTGSFSLTAGGLTNAAEFIINGYLTNGNVQMGGSIHSGNNSGYDNNPGQRWTTKRVTLNGGNLDDGGQAAKSVATNNWTRGLEWTTDNVSNLVVNSGYSYLAIAAPSTTTGTLLNVTTPDRNPGTSLYAFGPTATNKQFVFANAATWSKGAGGATNTQTMSVIPWIAVYFNGGFANPAGFGTYLSSGGVRVLADAEYATNLYLGADFNVSVASVALTNNMTVNALRYSANNASNIGTNRTLTVRSGGVFFSSGGGIIGATTNAGAGTLDFGAAEGIVWACGISSNTIGARITGSGGLTKASTGTLTLTYTNIYSGTTHVGGGTLRVGDGTSSGRLGTGNVTVHSGATLCISSDAAIDDTATVSLYKYGLFNGHVQIDAGRNETVKYLFLGGVGQSAGTYGSSASAATYKNDAYFSGAGVLSVTKSVAQAQVGTVVIVR